VWYTLKDFHPTICFHLWLHQNDFGNYNSQSYNIICMKIIPPKKNWNWRNTIFHKLDIQEIGINIINHILKSKLYDIPILMLQSMARNLNIDILNFKLFGKWKNHNQTLFVSMVWCKQKKITIWLFHCNTFFMCFINIWIFLFMNFELKVDNILNFHNIVKLMHLSTIQPSIGVNF